MNMKDVKEFVDKLHKAADETAIKAFVEQVYGPRCIHLEIETYPESDDEGGSYDIINGIWAYEDGKFQIQPNFAGVSEEDLLSLWSVRYAHPENAHEYVMQRVADDDKMEILVNLFNGFGCPVETAVYELKD